MPAGFLTGPSSVRLQTIGAIVSQLLVVQGREANRLNSTIGGSALIRPLHTLQYDDGWLGDAIHRRMVDILAIADRFPSLRYAAGVYCDTHCPAYIYCRANPQATMSDIYRLGLEPERVPKDVFCADTSVLVADILVSASNSSSASGTFAPTLA